MRCDWLFSWQKHSYSAGAGDVPTSRQGGLLIELGKLGAQSCQLGGLVSPVALAELVASDRVSPVVKGAPQLGHTGWREGGRRGMVARIPNLGALVRGDA